MSEQKTKRYELSVVLTDEELLGLQWFMHSIPQREYNGKPIKHWIRKANRTNPSKFCRLHIYEPK
jgi:hypothetical protein